MNFLVDLVLDICDSIPGMAARTRELDGRFKAPLRVVLALLGAGCIAFGAALARAAVQGFGDGSLGPVAAALIALAGATVLAAGSGCVRRGLRNPPPPPLPDNVIPLARFRAAAPSERASGSGFRHRP